MTKVCETNEPRYWAYKLLLMYCMTFLKSFLQIDKVDLDDSEKDLKTRESNGVRLSRQSSHTTHRYHHPPL